MREIQKIKDHLEKQFHLPPEQIDAMLPSFIETLSSHMNNLQLALEEGDLNILGRAGHTIKGAFLNLGLEECAEIALRIEQKGKAGDTTENYKFLLQQLTKKVDSVLQSADVS